MPFFKKKKKKDDTDQLPQDFGILSKEDLSVEWRKRTEKLQEAVEEEDKVWIEKWRERRRLADPSKPWHENQQSLKGSALHLFRMPYPIFFHVMNYLDPVDLLRLSEVNKLLYYCSNDPKIWKIQCERVGIEVTKYTNYKSEYKFRKTAKKRFASLVRYVLEHEDKDPLVNRDLNNRFPQIRCD